MNPSELNPMQQAAADTIRALLRSRRDGRLPVAIVAEVMRRRFVVGPARKFPKIARGLGFRVEKGIISL